MRNNMLHRCWRLTLPALMTLGLILPPTATADPFDNWEVHNHGATDLTFRALAYGNGVYVAAGSALARSVDGLHWTTIIRGDEIASGFQDIIFADGKFVAVGNGTSGGRSACSTNGLNWVLSSASTPNIFAFHDVTWGNGMFVAASMYSTKQQSGIFYSTDGTNWNPGAGIISVLVQGAPVNRVAFGNGLFFAKNTYPDGWKSANGAVWTRSYYAGAATPEFQFINGSFVFPFPGENRLCQAFEFTNGPATNIVYTGMSDTLSNQIELKGIMVAPVTNGLAYSVNVTNWVRRTIPALATARTPFTSDGSRLVALGTVIENGQTNFYAHRSGALGMQIAHTPPSLTFAGLTGVNYQIVSKGSINPNDPAPWTLVTNVAGGNDIHIIPLGFTNQSEFYRVMMAP